MPSIPLITASILSKKLAEGLDALVMDVKFGRAAFMQDREAAEALAQSIMALAEECGVTCRAMLSDMNTPLGRAAGNWLEVKEAIDCLEGRGPSDLEMLTVSLAANLPGIDSGRALAELASGRPREKFTELLAAQGADVDAFEQQLAEPAVAPVVREVTAPQSGVVVRCDARAIGELVRDLGGGRKTKANTIDTAVGVDQLAKPGEVLIAGTVLARVHAREETSAEDAVAPPDYACFKCTQRAATPKKRPSPRPERPKPAPSVAKEPTRRSSRAAQAPACAGSPPPPRSAPRRSPAYYGRAALVCSRAIIPKGVQPRVVRSLSSSSFHAPAMALRSPMAARSLSFLLLSSFLLLFFRHWPFSRASSSWRVGGDFVPASMLAALAV